jgi:fumarylacetoacetate (FAA) hydrolase
MRLATRDNGTPDGQLVVVSSDNDCFVAANGIATDLLDAMTRWADVAGPLAALAKQLEANQDSAEAFDSASALAPLPRSWQWLDGSAFPQHGLLMQKAFNLPPIESDQPLMYQGMSDRFYSGTADVPFGSEKDGIDFEGEFAVIVDHVPMGTRAADAMDHIKLVIQLNDWSLRTIAPVEMKTGFGWVQAKPACSVAPVAVTPDELGSAWSDGRVCLPLRVELNGKRFGEADGSEMEYGFHDLVAHAAATRDLVAGTIIGSGTVSNRDYATTGSSCISERRAIDMIEHGEIRTQFMSFGDRIRMEARRNDGRPLFGVIDQFVRPAKT